MENNFTVNEKGELVHNITVDLNDPQQEKEFDRFMDQLSKAKVFLIVPPSEKDADSFEVFGLDVGLEMGKIKCH